MASIDEGTSLLQRDRKKFIGLAPGTDVIFSAALLSFVAGAVTFNRNDNPPTILFYFGPFPASFFINCLTQFNIILYSSVLWPCCHVHTVDDFLNYGTLLSLELECLALPVSTEGGSCHCQPYLLMHSYMFHYE